MKAILMLSLLTKKKNRIGFHDPWISSNMNTLVFPKFQRIKSPLPKLVLFFESSIVTALLSLETDITGTAMEKGDPDKVDAEGTASSSSLYSIDTLSGTRSEFDATSRSLSFSSCFVPLDASPLFTCITGTSNEVGALLLVVKSFSATESIL